MRARTLLITIAAGASIAAIALLVTVLQPSGRVTESEADILDFDFFETLPSHRFAGALEQLGHEAPRVYRIGQEEVYFSARPTKLPPNRLVEEYQRAFVEHRVNAKMHTQPTSRFSPAAKDLLHGEVMTFAARPDYMEMGGGVLAGLPDTRDEVRATARGNARRPFEEIFRGFRHIEAHAVDGQTIVTAVWTDDEFDVNQMLDPGPADLDVPVCPGCVARPAFETVAGDIARKVHHFASPADVTDVDRFYRRALTDRGWHETNGVEEHTGIIRELAREERRLQIVLQPSAGGTDVTIIDGD